MENNIDNKINRSLSEILTEIKWYLKGRPSPPPHFIKQRTIKKFAKKFTPEIFIETGTNMGDTVMNVINIFKKIYSIELDTELFKKASDRFSRYNHVKILQGDSSKILPLILSEVKQPALFWLDGHYSGGVTAKGDLNTPIHNELKFIFAHTIKTHIILIDDARLFIGKDDYPEILDLQRFANQNNYSKFKVINDIIVIQK